MSLAGPSTDVTSRNLSPRRCTLSDAELLKSASARLPLDDDHRNIIKNFEKQTVIQNGKVVNKDRNVPVKPKEVVTAAGKYSIRHRHPDDLLHSRHPYAKNMQRRLVHKNGDVNVTKENIQKRRRRYLADIFTTLVDIQWRYNLLVFTMAFIISWFLFAILWYLISFSHGDLDHVGEPESEWKHCVESINNFMSSVLFSIETQHTIGYGSRRTTEECPEAIALMMIQSCFGVIIQALMTGIVFAKLSRPKKRAETLLFSRNACICKVDGEMCLLFRVGDMRKSHIVEAHVRAVVVKKKVTAEGGTIPLYQFDVNLGYNDGSDRLFLVWPVVVVHKIDEDSPFWEIGAQDLHREQFELIVILEGIVESTGMTTQARSSYLPNEILWGHYYERLVTFRPETCDYQVDFSRFHHTIAIEMTHLCASDQAAGLERHTGILPSQRLTQMSLDRDEEEERSKHDYHKRSDTQMPMECHMTNRRSSAASIKPSITAIAAFMAKPIEGPIQHVDDDQSSMMECHMTNLKSLMGLKKPATELRKREHANAHASPKRSHPGQPSSRQLLHDTVGNIVKLRSFTNSIQSRRSSDTCVGKRTIPPKLKKRQFSMPLTIKVTTPPTSQSFKSVLSHLSDSEETTLVSDTDNLGSLHGIEIVNEEV